ncbi:quinol monooxygenase YgiN [Mycetocola sp. CAN_C7]|uniref:putative quinol monooxygenase n=1 Tax=Mycetocola sp. CAN_C7 TaxID=2787724 RepID=UPI0018CB4738
MTLIIERPTLYAEFTATPGQADAVAALLAGLVDAVRTEEGNIVFDAHRKTDEPETFFVYEVYADRNAFETHLASLHSVEFNRALTPLVEGGGSTLTWLRPLD